MADRRSAIIRAARDELWRRGELAFLLHEGQRELGELLAAHARGTFVLEIARRYGKTFFLLVRAGQTCLNKPGARVVYGAPTLKHLEEFILPTAEKVFAGAPADCKPVFNQASGHLNFPNGSYIHLFGADDKRKADRGRGPEADLAIFDEAGFCGILRYVIRSVLRPQLLHTGGRILLASTPAEEPDHDFTAMAERAEANGLYARRTIWDNPLLAPEQIQQFIEDDAKDEGLTVEQYVVSDDFRREYKAERVVNKLLVVVPEWEAKRSKLIQAVPRPEFFDGITMLDFGGHDPHAAAWGYWHFTLAKWIIEDELLLHEGQNTAFLADAIKTKERGLWGTSKFEGTLRGAFDSPEQHMLDSVPEWMRDILVKEAPAQPRERWSDNNLQLVRDLYELHGLVFLPTAKDDKQLQVNNFRVMVNADEILVHPRCVGLDRHLKTTTWQDHKRKTYARHNKEHGDLLDCVVYGARNLSRRNPIPEGMRPAPETRVLAANRVQGLKTAQAFLGNSPLARKLMGQR